MSECFHLADTDIESADRREFRTRLAVSIACLALGVIGLLTHVG